jgi:hypothetical protein
MHRNESVVELDADDAYVASIAYSVQDPGEADSCPGTDLQHPAARRHSLGEQRKEPTHARFGRQLESQLSRPVFCVSDRRRYLHESNGYGSMAVRIENRTWQTVPRSAHCRE